MAGETTRERRERLDAINARLGRGEHTRDDVVWLWTLADEYIRNWEDTVARMRRRSERARSTDWAAEDPRIADARAKRRGRSPG